MRSEKVWRSERNLCRKNNETDPTFLGCLVFSHFFSTRWELWVGESGVRFEHRACLLSLESAVGPADYIIPPNFRARAVEADKREWSVGSLGGFPHIYVYVRVDCDGKSSVFRKCMEKSMEKIFFCRIEQSRNAECNWGSRWRLRWRRRLCWRCVVKNWFD